MRRAGDTRMRPVGMFGRQRLGPEGIKRGMADPPGFERRQQRGIVDQRAAPRIEDHRALGQVGQRRGRENVAGGRGVGQQQYQDLGTFQRGGQPVGAVQAGEVRDGAGAAAPPGGVKAKPGQGFGAGAAQLAQSQHADPSVARQRRHVVRPAAVQPVNIGVEAQMVAQHMAGDPFDHAAGQPVIDHARQRHAQGRVVHHRLDPGPEVEHRFQPLEGGEIADLLAGGVDDVIHRFRGVFGAQVIGQAGGVQRAAQRCLIGGPAGRIGGEQDICSHLKSSNWCARAGGGYGRSGPARRRRAGRAWPSHHS